MSEISFKKPADTWNEALPLGNGKIGAMVYSGVFTDYIKLNEETLWSGMPDGHEYIFPPENIRKIRRAVIERRYTDATKLTEEIMHGYSSQAYLSLGSIIIETRTDNKRVSGYKRTLDLETAVLSTEFKIGKTQFYRTAFVSAPDNVFAVRLESSEPCAYNITLACELEHSMKSDAKGILVQGRCPTNVSKFTGAIDYSDDESIHFSMRLSAVSDGDVYSSGGMICVKETKDVTLYFCVETSFSGYDRLPVSEGREYLERCRDRIKNAASMPYDELINRHLSDYSEFYNRVSLNIPSDENSKLLFDYGRYLMISSSRPGTQPSNLQGIWSCDAIAPWHSNYTLNINTQMNYWPAEVCRLGECALPLFEMLVDFSERGNHFGLKGWSTWHNSDIWRFNCEATKTAMWGFWPMSGAWLCRHIWEHYLHTGDMEFLEKYFSVMKGAVDFLCDWVTYDRDGKFTTIPSTSPENCFIYDGVQTSVCSGSAIDLEIISDTVDFVSKACELLGYDYSEYKSLTENLAELKIGSDGRLLEWNEEFSENEKGHRHVSHLYGIYPADVLINDIELRSAAKKSLIFRLENGGGHTGWSNAWIVCLFARFGDGEAAYRYIENMLKKSIYPNYLDAHPPFQIDGNFGICAAIAEMLLQSHEIYECTRVISLLPAVPECWGKGEFKHFLSRGGADVSVSWGEKTVSEIVIGHETRLIIKCADRKISRITDKSGKEVKISEVNGGTVIEGKTGDAFRLEFKRGR